VGRRPWLLCIVGGSGELLLTTIGSLRMLALASNVLFSTYGLLAHIYPVVLLHMILLPINLLKLYRLQNRKPSRQSAQA
jgi:hypothetical protein